MSQHLILAESRESSRPGPGPGAEPPVDPEVTELVGALQKVGRQLQSRRALDHPRVRAALGQFDEELSVVLGESRGRHRGTLKDSGRTAAAENSSDFVRALRDYHLSHGNIPFREVARRARHIVTHSTICVALNGDALPSLEVVIAIVVGCGGSAADQERFVAAWHHLRKAGYEPQLRRRVAS